MEKATCSRGTSTSAAATEAATSDPDPGHGRDVESGVHYNVASGPGEATARIQARSAASAFRPPTSSVLSRIARFIRDCDPLLCATVFLGVVGLCGIAIAIIWLIHIWILIHGSQ